MNYPRLHTLATLAVLLGFVIVLSSCDGKEAKVLRVWQTETDKGAVEELNRTIEIFQAEHPGVQVELESVAWSSLSDKLSVAVQSGNEPDVAHLEPFMASSLVGQNLLLPIDDVIQEVEEENGPIYRGVRDLQLFQGRRYGIAYAVGTTGWSYRKDVAARLGLSAPRKWSDYVVFARRLREEGDMPLLLPGGDPFFVDQLFAELVANNGGRLFDPVTNRPMFTDKRVIETLTFLRDLAPALDGGWQTQPYLDQFNRLARGEAGNVPVTYARAAKAITSAVDAGDSGKVGPETFAWMEQPTGPSFSGLSIATIDCEPFVIFQAAADRGNVDLAKEFLRLFFRSDRYLPFVKKVPIHLTPIFERMARSPEYREQAFNRQWKQWADQTDKFLSDPDRVRPIMMPDISESGRQLRFLLEFQASKIITQAVSDVMKNDVPVDRAAQTAQEAGERLIESLGLRRW